MYVEHLKFGPASQAELERNYKIRYDWDRNFTIDWPEDWSLAIEQGIKDDIPKHLLELYSRFWDMGFLHRHGSHCVFMASLLRRVLRIHGYPAQMRQVMFYYRHSEKNKIAQYGTYEKTLEKDRIDTHMVVVSDGFILDFAVAGLMEDFGATFPRAFIARDLSHTDDYQKFGEMHGEATWTRSYPEHHLIKQWRLDQKKYEIDCAREYFNVYKI